MAGFLGINSTYDKQTNSLTMAQTYLIESTLAAMDMVDYNHNIPQQTKTHGVKVSMDLCVVNIGTTGTL